MSANKKARPSAPTPGRAIEPGQSTTDKSRSTLDFTTRAGKPQGLKIYQLLSTGRENAVPLKHLASITGLDGRTVRLMIATERLSGIPICSDNATGYFLPANGDERDAFVRSMRHRAGEIERVADALEGAPLNG